MQEAAQKIAVRADPQAKVYSLVTTAIKDGDFECAIVCSPTLTHATIVKELLEAGKVPYYLIVALP